MFGGEVVGRIDDLPTTKDLIHRIIKEASEILKTVPENVLRS